MQLNGISLIATGQGCFIINASQGPHGRIRIMIGRKISPPSLGKGATLSRSTYQYSITRLLLVIDSHRHFFLEVRRPLWRVHTDAVWGCTGRSPIVFGVCGLDSGKRTISSAIFNSLDSEFALLDKPAIHSMVVFRCDALYSVPTVGAWPSVHSIRRPWLLSRPSFVRAHPLIKLHKIILTLRQCDIQGH